MIMTQLLVKNYTKKRYIGFISILIFSMEAACNSNEFCLYHGDHGYSDAEPALP